MLTRRLCSATEPELRSAVIGAHMIFIFRSMAKQSELEDHMISSPISQSQTRDPEPSTNRNSLFLATTPSSHHEDSQPRGDTSFGASISFSPPVEVVRCNAEHMSRGALVKPRGMLMICKKSHSKRAGVFKRPEMRRPSPGRPAPTTAATLPGDSSVPGTATTGRMYRPTLSPAPGP